MWQHRRFAEPASGQTGTWNSTFGGEAAVMYKSEPASGQTGTWNSTCGGKAEVMYKSSRGGNFKTTDFSCNDNSMAKIPSPLTPSLPTPFLALRSMSKTALRPRNRVSELSTMGCAMTYGLTQNNQDGAKLKNGHTLDDAKPTLTLGSSAFLLYFVLPLISLRPPPPEMI